MANPFDEIDSLFRPGEHMSKAFRAFADWLVRFKPTLPELTAFAEWWQIHEWHSSVESAEFLRCWAERRLPGPDATDLAEKLQAMTQATITPMADSESYAVRFRAWVIEVLSCK